MKIEYEDKIKESERKFRNIIDSIPMGIHMYQLEHDGRLIFTGANPAADKILGVKNAQFIGKTIEEAFPPLAETEVPIRYRKTAKEGVPWNTEQISYEDEQISGAFEVHSFQTSPGKMAALFLDITERKRAEQQIKESERKYRFIVDNMTDMIAKTDKEGRFEFVSPSYCKKFGRTEEELLGQHFLPLVHREDRESTIKARSKILKYPYTTRFEQRAFTKNGWRWIAWADKAILDSDENVIGGIGVGRDVTERVLAEEALKESEEKFRRLADQSLVGLAIIQDNRARYLNRKMEEIIGHPYEELMKWSMKDYLKIVHPDYADFVSEQLRKKQSGTPDIVEDYEFCFYGKMGELKWARVFSKTVNYDGRPADFICQVDITKRKEIENQLINSEKKYRKAYNRAEFYKDLFAHDINNILQNISMATELNLFNIQTIEEKKDLEDSLQIILDQVNRGGKLVTNIQTISQLEDEPIPLKPTEVLGFLKESISFIENSFHHKKPNIQLKSDSKKIMVLANDFLQEIFDNILLNAIQHADKTNVSVLIKISKEKIEGSNFYKFQFIDNGSGIPDEMKDEIFLRSQDKNVNAGGMGLGLSLVKKIVKSYGGRIWVEDKISGDYSQGSNFIVVLPEFIEKITNTAPLL